jgi:F0F1-type ATP synthase epsilon subunit
LEIGTVTYVTKEGRLSLPVRGGFVSVQKNEVNVCVEV